MERILRSPHGGNKPRAMEILLPELIRRDIREAAALAADLPDWASAAEVMKKVLAAWAEKDAEAAAAWCAEPGVDPQWLCYLCREASARDPGKALALLERHSATPDPGTAGNILQRWALADPAAAMAWVESRTDTPAREQGWNRIARALAETDPVQAATLAVERIGTEALQEETVISVLHQWALRDREAAAAWVADFPDGPLRDRAAGELAPSDHSPPMQP